MSSICRVSISPKDANEVCPLHFVVYSFCTRWEECAVNLLQIRHITFYHNAGIWSPYPIMSMYVPSPIEITPYTLEILVPYPFSKSSYTVVHD